VSRGRTSEIKSPANPPDETPDVTLGRNATLRLCLLGLSLAPLSVLVVAACGVPEPPPYKPFADNKLLMKAVMEPAADLIWASVGTILDKSGTTEIRPGSTEEWLAVRNAAVTVTESGNLMMMVPRAKDGGEWMRLSTAMIDKGSEIVQAADAKNPEKIFTLGGELFDICTNCHSKYKPAVLNTNQ